MKKNNNFKKNSRPIRGSEKPYLSTEIIRIYNDLIKRKGYVNLNDLDFLRDAFKNTVAIYYRYAATRNGFKKIDVNETCKNIIANSLSNETNVHIYGFIQCTLDFYMQIRPDIIELNMSGACCNSPDPDKVFTKADRNTETLMQKRIDKLIHKIKRGDWENVDYERVAQYMAIPIAIKYVSGYLHIINNGTLPEIVDRETYSKALSYDKKISDYYKLSDDDNYHLNEDSYSSKMPLFNVLSKECGAVLYWEDIRKKKDKK